MARKKKKIPLHIKHEYKQYSYEDGGLTITFWAKDDEASKDYIKLMEERNAKK